MLISHLVLLPSNNVRSNVRKNFRKNLYKRLSTNYAL